MKQIAMNRCSMNFAGLSVCLLLALVFASAGCKKAEPAAPTVAEQPPAAPTAENPAPIAAPPPAAPRVITADPNANNMDATLMQLTREVRKAMIGRHIPHDFDAVMKLRNVQVPPAPAGKKYAIDQKWYVVLVDQ